ncbi:hypothetical protein RUND412_006276 [Rhizina undulata]
MKPRNLFSAVLSLSTTISAVHGGRQPIDIIRRGAPAGAFNERALYVNETYNSFASYKYYNNITSKYWVNGSGIPDVNFDVGESYAGLIPISENKTEDGELYFWFFPSKLEEVDDLVIWLNGGPGLEGLLQENGPFQWKAGTFLPVVNEYSWTNLTNMLWVEQPIGTGFSPGTPTATSSAEVAQQFISFFKNFLDTFGLTNKKIYVTGESYAGYYVPYIVDAMYNANETEHFDVRGLMIYDPVLSYDVVQEQLPVPAFVNYWSNIFALNDTTMATLEKMDKTCGYTAYLEEYLKYPPAGPLPTPPQVNTTVECDVWDYVFDAVLNLNPCFNVYEITTECPMLWDVLGFPGSFEYLPAGAEIYFNRTDVQTAINAPATHWATCSSINVYVNGTDNSPPVALSILPGLIEKNERTIIGHGKLDFILVANGTLLSIQNMTWNGEQGFQTPPVEPFVVPYDGQGTLGKVHTERSLTYVEIEYSGHMVPGFQPGAAYYQLQYLLGRIDAL